MLLTKPGASRPGDPLAETTIKAAAEEGNQGKEVNQHKSDLKGVGGLNLCMKETEESAEQKVRWEQAK